jgi:hypothetical protein
VKDGGYKYFIQILSDQSMQCEYRTMAAFVLSVLVDDNFKGQVWYIEVIEHYVVNCNFFPGGLSSEQCHISVSLPAGGAQSSSQTVAGSVLGEALAQV